MVLLDATPVGLHAVPYRVYGHIYMVYIWHPGHCLQYGCAMLKVHASMVRGEYCYGSAGPSGVLSDVQHIVQYRLKLPTFTRGLECIEVQVCV